MVAHFQLLQFDHGREDWQELVCKQPFTVNLKYIMQKLFALIATFFHLLLHVANAPESDKQDLKSELELMKTLKPHPHVIKLLECVTESGK